MDQYLINPSFKVNPKTVTVDMSKYRERVLNLTSELFEQRTTDAHLQEQFMQYVSECVSYLYRKELTDVCQAEYKSSLECILEEGPEKQVTIFNRMMKHRKPETKFPMKKEINDI